MGGLAGLLVVRPRALPGGSGTDWDDPGSENHLPDQGNQTRTSPRAANAASLKLGKKQAYLHDRGVLTIRTPKNPFRARDFPPRRVI
jgi:hypothetical protein